MCIYIIYKTYTEHIHIFPMYPRDLRINTAPGHHGKPPTRRGCARRSRARPGRASPPRRSELQMWERLPMVNTNIVNISLVIY